MFTGIITDIGTVRRIDPGTDTRMEIATAFDVDDIDIGASIACAGPCLTVVSKGADGAMVWTRRSRCLSCLHVIRWICN